MLRSEGGEVGEFWEVLGRRPSWESVRGRG